MERLWPIVAGVSVLLIVMPLVIRVPDLGAYMEYLKSIEIPYSQQMISIFAKAKIDLSPLKWVSSIVGIVMLGLLIGGVSHHWNEGAFGGIGLAAYFAWYPFSRIRKRQAAYLYELNRLILMQRILVRQGVRTYEILQIVTPTIQPPLRTLMEQMLKMLETTYTLEDALDWLVVETGLVEFRQWANQVILTEQYDTESANRLLEMSEENREDEEEALEKRTSKKYWSAIFIGIGLIAFPIVCLTLLLSTHQVLANYNKILVH